MIDGNKYFEFADFFWNGNRLCIDMYPMEFCSIRHTELINDRTVTSVATISKL